MDSPQLGGISQRSGFDSTNLTSKGEVYRNDLHETLVSAGLVWGIGHSGAQGVGTNAPDSPRGEKTRATMNPGLSYVAVTWQIAAEAIVPLNSEAGRSIGARAQLLLFLDDLIPSLFGKSLLSR
jgi:hypothetical protein